MKNPSTGIVSVIGLNLIEPLLELIDNLQARPLNEPNEVQANQPENGYSCAIIALSVFVLESAINRTRYIRKDNEKKDIAEYLSEISSDVELAKDIKEVIAIRDVIVHNHLWEANVYWDDNDNWQLKFSELPKLLGIYGNKRFRSVLNETTRTSHRLNLNLFPLRIWRQDAFKVLKAVGRALSTLESLDHNYFSISQGHFMFHGRLQSWNDILSSLPS